MICLVNFDGFFRVNCWVGLVDIPDRRRSPVQPLKGSPFYHAKKGHPQNLSGMDGYSNGCCFLVK